MPDFLIDSTGESRIRIKQSLKIRSGPLGRNLLERLFATVLRLVFKLYYWGVAKGFRFHVGDVRVMAIQCPEEVWEGFEQIFALLYVKSTLQQSVVVGFKIAGTVGRVTPIAGLNYKPFLGKSGLSHAKLLLWIDGVLHQYNRVGV